jgi:hypothetical protein
VTSKEIAIEHIVESIVHEIGEAEREHPEWPVDPIHAAGIIVEEAGELMRECLQVTYEMPEKPAATEISIKWEQMAHEATQTAAMALRFLLMFNRMIQRPSEQVRYNGSG